MEHYDFLSRTDRRSVHAQLKILVEKSKNFYQDELRERRAKLKKLLDDEDKLYEEKFTKKVLSRIDENLKERREVLMTLKKENAKTGAKFLNMKLIQHNINNCAEIRDAIRQKERMQVQKCQLEQIVEKERQLVREREMEQAWANVYKKDCNQFYALEKQEQYLREKVKEETNRVLALQVKDHEMKRQKEHEEKLEEASRINKIIHEVREEQFKKRTRGELSPRQQQYRTELLKQAAEERERKQNESLHATSDHRRMCEELRRIEEEEKESLRVQKRAFYRETIEYLNYLQRMRTMERDWDKLRSDHVTEMRRIDFCTKMDMERERQQRAKVAALCHAELKMQVCEQYERRLREEIERRENKVLVDYFTRDQAQLDQRNAIQQKKNQEDLKKQMVEIALYRKQEEEDYEKSLQQANRDPVYCKKLAEEYIRKSVDYLKPHIHWLTLACPRTDNALAPPNTYSHPGA